MRPGRSRLGTKMTVTRFGMVGGHRRAEQSQAHHPSFEICIGEMLPFHAVKCNRLNPPYNPSTADLEYRHDIANLGLHTDKTPTGTS